MRRTARRLLVPVLLAALALPLNASPAAAVTTWTGTVTGVFDGDTYQVKLRNGTVWRVRMANIQAMELTDYSKKIGDCHGPEAERRLRQLILNKRVRLKAMNPNSTSYRRKLRFTEVYRNGAWRDVGKIMLTEGHALWSSHPVEHLRSRSYHLAAERAAARGRNLWNTSYCGSGPAQEAPLKTWVNWDAEGPDNLNVNGEWIKIRNLHPTLTVPLRGWSVRDSALRSYRFPSTATIPPGGTVTVHPGRGVNTEDTFYWGLSAAVFPNVIHATHIGDGAYVFDKHGDLRSWFTYPCVTRCGDAATGSLSVKANYDAEGDDTKNVNGEWVDLRNNGMSVLDLERYILKLDDAHNYPLSGMLLPQQTLRLYVGRGIDTELTRYWGKGTSIMNNKGGVVQVRTFADVRIACYHWGGASC